MLLCPQQVEYVGPGTKKWSWSGSANYHSQRPTWGICAYHFPKFMLFRLMGPGSKSAVLPADDTINVLLDSKL